DRRRRLLRDREELPDFSRNGREKLCGPYRKSYQCAGSEYATAAPQGYVHNTHGLICNDFRNAHLQTAWPVCALRERLAARLRERPSGNANAGVQPHLRNRHPSHANCWTEHWATVNSTPAPASSSC